MSWPTHLSIVFMMFTLDASKFWFVVALFDFLRWIHPFFRVFFGITQDDTVEKATVTVNESLNNVFKRQDHKPCGCAGLACSRGPLTDAISRGIHLMLIHMESPEPFLKKNRGKK